MKKIIFSLSALAALLLAGSCQRENLEPVEQGGTVTYTVQVPGALATKADGDGFVAYYEVYRQGEVEDGTKSPVYEGSQPFENGSAKIELEFVKDQNFVVLFWAQKVGVQVYDIKDLRNVSISKTQKLTSNNFDAEVYAGNDLVENCASKKGGNVVLFRPIAQLNIATDSEGLLLGTTPVQLKKSYVKVTGLSATYNVYKGYGSTETANAAYGMADVPTDNITVGTESYNYVAMNYIGFMPQSDITVDVDFTIQTSEGNINHTVSNVPVKANYKTNIIGNLITATDNYQVTLGDWETEETNLLVVDSATGLKEAIDNAKEGEEITLTGDIDLSELFPIVIAEGKSVVLNLNGYTITTPFVAGSTTNHAYAFENHGVLTIKDTKGEGEIVARGIFNYGKMTLESGTINACDGNGGYGVRNYKDAEFVMNGGSIITSLEDDHQVDEGGYDATTLRVDEGATATINDGTINNICDFTFAIDNAGTVTINGGTFTSVHTTVANKASMTIEGGSFTCNGLEGITAHALWADAGTTTINGGTFDGKDNFNGFNVDASAGAVVNITGGKFLPVHSGSLYGAGTISVTGGEFFDDPAERVAEGFIAEKNGEVWVVAKVPVAQIGEDKYYTLEDAVKAAKAGDTVTVIDDVELSSELALPAGIIFNGNGKQINGTIYAGAEGNLTFAGHTKVTSFSASYYNRTITIGEGACLEVTGTGRVTLGYGNTFNITGGIENAKTADKANVQPSLIIPGGISITGGNNATMNVTKAYVKIGNTSSKNTAANGTFTLNIKNSIVDFTDQFTLSEPKDGMNPTFKVNVENSVLTTVKKFCIAAKNSTIEVDNSSITTYNNVRNSGTINLKNGSLLSGNTIQFGENGGNDGTITVDNSTLTVKADSPGHAFDGKGIGSISATNGATVKVDYYKAMTINTDATSTFEGTEVQ